MLFASPAEARHSTAWKERHAAHALRIHMERANPVITTLTWEIFDLDPNSPTYGQWLPLGWQVVRSPITKTGFR